MSPGRISERVVADRLDWIIRMIKEIESLPLEDYESFTRDKRNVWSAESCLRRSLEALMDLGRHILAKGFDRGVGEYKEIASCLEESGVLDEQQSDMFKRLAGYRNRIVHFIMRYLIKNCLKYVRLSFQISPMSLTLSGDGSIVTQN